MLEILETRIAPAALIFADNDASGYDTATPVTVDDVGNIIVAGTFDERITLDDPFGGAVTLTTQAPGNLGTDVYVAKYSPTGALLWATSWGGVPMGGAMGPEEVLADVAVDAAGDVYALLSFSTINAGFGGGGVVSATGAGTNDTVVLKLSGATGAPANSFGTGGMVIWGGSEDDTGAALTLSGGNLYFSGTYASANARLGSLPGYPPASGDEIYAIKINAADGGPVGAFGTMGMIRFGGPGPDRVIDAVASAASGDLFIAARGANTFVSKFRGSDGSADGAFGVGGLLDIPNLATIALDNSGRLLASGGIASPGGYLKRFASDTGVPDVTFDTDGTVDMGTNAQSGTSIVVDGFDRIYVGGAKSLKNGTPSPYFIAKFRDDGSVDTNFGTSGRITWAISGADDHRSLKLAVDSDGYLTARGFFSGTTDIDPTKSARTVTAHPPSPTTLHPALDTFLVRLDPNGVDATNSFTFTDTNGEAVKFSFKGAGRLSVIPGTTPGVDIERIEAIDTDATSTLSIRLGKGAIGTTIAHIVTPGFNQHVGIVKLASNITLGDGLPGTPALEITGSVQKVTLGNIAPNATIKLGGDLPYDDPNPLVPDSYNLRPQFNIRDVGAGTTIDVTGDGMPAGTGGGGLGRIFVQSWAGAGLIKTTQSVTSFKLKTGDCYVVFELDKFGLGVSTRAGMGSISIPNGAWGSSGSEIEGNCGSFTAASFLASASLTAAYVNNFTVNSGNYAGTLTLTDPSAPGIGTVKVAADFVGYVTSAASLKNVKVTGDFLGSLVAASIGSITAFQFDGAAVGDGVFGDSDRFQIIATSGSLGAIKTKGGGIKNYEIQALTTFGGFSISTGSGTSVDVTGIENCSVAASEIGKITVALKPSIGGLTLIGIDDSEFDSEFGVGNITSSHNIVDSQFSGGANMGNILVGSTLYPTSSISGSRFYAGANLGGDWVIDGDETYARSGKIGNITVKGSLTTTTFSAGINAGADFIFGTNDDTAAAGVLPPLPQKAIGAVTIGAGSGTLTGSPTLTHDYVIQAGNLKSLKINNVAAIITGLPKFLKIGGSEATSDILLRTV